MLPYLNKTRMKMFMHIFRRRNIIIVVSIICKFPDIIRLLFFIPQLVTNLMLHISFVLFFLIKQTKKSFSKAENNYFFKIALGQLTFSLYYESQVLTQILVFLPSILKQSKKF